MECDSTVSPAEAPAPRRRGRRRQEDAAGLDRERLVAAMLNLAEREGEHSLNMRRIAAELGVSPRLLYYHVRSKDELLDLLADAITARCRFPRAHLDWQERLVAIQCALRAEILKYPGVPYRILVRSTQRFNSPRATAVADEMREALRMAGLDSRQVEHAYTTLHAYFMGHLLLSEAHRNSADSLTTDAEGCLGSGGFEKGLRDIIAGFAAAAVVS